MMMYMVVLCNVPVDKVRAATLLSTTVVAASSEWNFDSFFEQFSYVYFMITWSYNLF